MRKTTREPAPAIQAQESPPPNATASSQKHARKTRRRIERDREEEEEEKTLEKREAKSSHLVRLPVSLRHGCSSRGAPASRRTLEPSEEASGDSDGLRGRAGGWLARHGSGERSPEAKP